MCAFVPASASRDSLTGSETPWSLLLILQVSVMAKYWGMLEVTEIFLLF